MRIKKLILFLFSVLGISLIILVSCDSSTTNLPNRAVSFYNLFTGKNTRDRLSDFLPPSVSKKAEGEAFEIIEEFQKRISESPLGRKEEVKLKDVMYRISGHFGVTWIVKRGDLPLAQTKPVKWVKEGRIWYLYYATPEQVEKYGTYPVELIPTERPIPRVIPSEEKREKGELRDRAEEKREEQKDQRQERRK